MSHKNNNSMSKQKLELTWIGKDQRPRLEPRILLEDPKRSYHAKQRVADGDFFDNRLIKGDNLLALKALEAEFAGKVKCVFIDPPYNTGSAFTHYDDGLEHSIWLGLMRDRLEIIRRLLADDGSLWITIDDNEAHYLKVVCDEIFGRSNFVVSCVWENDKGGRGDADISQSHDYVLLYARDRALWSKTRNLLPRDGVAPRTWWSADEVGTNQGAKSDHLNKLLVGIEPFGTPKPESLLNRIIHIATNPGDLVLDSFAGSGTTGAVAHKMGRRWIMVEVGEHCHTHIVPRLQKVIDGQDPGGVTQATGWQGGGGFRYYELAPTLLSTDRWGNLVINPAYDAAMLSAAMCKLEGFSYAPSEVLWWQQGRSSETDFIYVTTQTLGPEQLDALSSEVGADPHNPRTLLVCCGAYRGVTATQATQRWSNLTIKKIPKMVKDRCEWGHDDYSLNVANLPMAQKKVAAPAQDDLFGGGT